MSNDMVEAVYPHANIENQAVVITTVQQQKLKKLTTYK